MADQDTPIPGGGWVPVPDPTTLTTQQLHRELGALREYLELQIASARELFTQRADDADKAVGAAFNTAKEAVDKAEAANEKRLDAVNEFRAQQQDLISGFISRREYDTAQQALSDSISDNRERIESLTRQLVPRAETDAWRSAITEKSDLATQRNYEAIHRLESRFDALQGSIAGSGSERTERRLDLGQIIAVVAVILAAISIAAFLLKK